MVKSVLMVKNLVKTLRSGERMFTIKVDSLDVEEAAFKAIMGPNGSGKSILTLLLTGALVPDEGEVVICDRFPPTKLSGRKHFSYLPEVGFLNPGLSGNLNIEIFSRITAASFGRNLREIKNRIYRFLSLLDLKSEELQKPMKALSVGTRRKVEIAITLAADVPLYVLDMPTSGLDPLSRQKFLLIVQQIRAKGATFLISTHIPDEAKAADVVLFIKDGAVITSIPPKEVSKYIKNVVVVRFNPSEKDKVCEVLRRTKGAIGDDEVRFYNVGPDSIDSIFKLENIAIIDLYETYPHIGDLYSFLTGDTASISLAYQ